MNDFYTIRLILIFSLIYLLLACSSEKEKTSEEVRSKTDIVSKEDDKNKNERVENQFITYEYFIAKDEKLLEQNWGDLNKDGKKDVVLIVEKTDPKNMIYNEGLGVDTLNCNPRKIMVLFYTKSGYEKVVENIEFVPSENSSVSPCLADPLEDGYVEIKKGVLRVSFNYWLSCGSWEMSTNTYVFRYQNDQVELIGFDYSSIHRASGEIREGSFNFMTMKKELKTGGNIADDSEENVKIARSKITGERLYDLAEITQDWSQRLFE